MRYMWAVVIVLCVVASGAWAQTQNGLLTARSLGMGTAAIGVADDAAAWLQNPAGLARLNLAAPEGKNWGSNFVATYLNVDEDDDGYLPTQVYGDDSFHGFAGTWSAWQPAKAWGLGAGYANVDDVGEFYGAGVGDMLGRTNWSWGANFLTSLPEDGDREIIVNLGIMGMLARNLKLGVICEDVRGHGEDSPLWNAGLAWMASNSLLVAADVLDVAGDTEEGPFFNAGAELALGGSNAWKLRAGAVDSGDGHDFTAGVGGAFGRCTLDFGYADIEGGMWEVSAGCAF